MPNVYTVFMDNSDHEGALSCSSNDTVDSEDVSLGILPDRELWYELLQESDVNILMLVPTVSGILQLLHMSALLGAVQY